MVKKPFLNNLYVIEYQQKEYIKVMKKLLLLVCFIFCNYSAAHANLAYDKGYWIEEISKTGVLNQNMIDKHTIENLNLTRVPANGAFHVADIIKKNKTIRNIQLDDSDFNDEGALAISQSLSANNTLQILRISNSKFSIPSREALRKAWSMNNVEGRQQEIEF